jgi:hypothetical protein
MLKINFDKSSVNKDFDYFLYKVSLLLRCGEGAIAVLGMLGSAIAVFRCGGCAITFWGCEGAIAVLRVLGVR